MTLVPDTRVLLRRTPTSTATIPAIVERARAMPVSGRMIYTFNLGNRWRVLTEDMLGQVVAVVSRPLVQAA